MGCGFKRYAKLIRIREGCVRCILRRNNKELAYAILSDNFVVYGGEHMKWHFILGLGLMAGSVSAESWTDRVKVGGDLRYRHEMEAQEVPHTANDTRHRQRIRARVSLDGRVNDRVKVGLRVATGDGGNVSTNQSLDGNGANKVIDFDLAYFEWAFHPCDGCHNQLFKIIGGKMKHQVYRPGKSELMFDDDLTPEGIAIRYDGKVFANFNAHWLDERFAVDSENKDNPDAIMYGGQVGVQWETGVSGGVGFYDFTSVKGGKALTDLAGNTFTKGLYDNEFKILQAFLEVQMEVVGRPLSLFIDYMQNTYPEDNTDAYLLGLKYGKVKTFGDFQGVYTYREVQADSVIGSLNDSDFISGGTDGRGHEVKLKWGVADKATLGLIYFMNTKNIQNGLVETDFNLTQLDFAVKF